MVMCASTGATMSCKMGSLPSTLIVPPTHRVFESTPLMAAGIMDILPYVNILPFGMCTSPALIAAVVAAAAASGSSSGVPLAVPCIPACPPWIPTQPTVLVGPFPILTPDSKNVCGWGGDISMEQPGQFTVQTTGAAAAPEIEFDMQANMGVMLNSTTAAADHLIAEGKAEEALDMLFQSALLSMTPEDGEAPGDLLSLDVEEMSPEQLELFKKIAELQKQIKAEKEAAGIEDTDEEDELFDIDFIVETWATELDDET